jgi:NTP-dependent ternary system trypsin peptidase co-occuring protein
MGEDGPEDGDGSIELSDAIGVVREQLVAAQLAGRRVVAGRALSFAVGKVSLEFTGEVKKVAGGGGGVKFWVFTADAKVERTSGVAQKVTVELIPQGPDGESFLVADDVDVPPPD